MLNYSVTENEITVFWNYIPERDKNIDYTVTVNGNNAGVTDKTFYSIYGLSADELYRVEIEYYIRGEKKMMSVNIRTKKMPQITDVSKPPYNCKGDGKTDNTVALQRAIDDCTDGCVYLPSGVYMTGALNLHGNMELRLDKGAVLKGFEDKEHYLPKIRARSEGIETDCYRSLINIGKMDCKVGCTTENITISGGSIIGGGNVLRKDIINYENGVLVKLGKTTADTETDTTVAGRARGRLISINNARKIVIKDTTLGYSPFWNVHYVYCENVVIYNCYVKSFGISNGDGIDPDSSRNSYIFNTVFETGDDAIAIKSGKNPEGNIINRPSENINIFGCKSITSHGIAMGSEMSGGISGVSIWDCDFRETWYAVHVKGTKKRGGYVKGVKVYNSLLSCVFVESVGYNDDGEGAENPPIFKDMLFEDLFITGVMITYTDFAPCEYFFIKGFDVPGYEVSDVVIRNVTLKKPFDLRKQKTVFELVKNVKTENVKSEN